MDAETARHYRAKVAWRCRRGMLELDLRLAKFLVHGYDQLSEAEIVAFLDLLEHPDPVILSWLLGETTPDRPCLSAIISKLGTMVSSLDFTA